MCEFFETFHSSFFSNHLIDLLCLLQKILRKNKNTTRQNKLHKFSKIKDMASTSYALLVKSKPSGKYNPACIYLFKVNNGNTRKIYSKSAIKTPERRQLIRSGVFIVYFEQISHIVLFMPLLTLNK